MGYFTHSWGNFDKLFYQLTVNCRAARTQQDDCEFPQAPTAKHGAGFFNIVSWKGKLH